MNKQTSNKLEKIINSVKESVRETARDSLKFVRDKSIILTLGTALAIGNVAYGGNLRVYNYSSTQAGSSISAKHIEGATETYDMGIDALYLNSPNPFTNIF